MKKEMLINVLQPEECRIAIVEDGVLEELYVERTSQESYVGNIYKGRIVNIEPSIQAAFVDFGIGRNGFLHVSDVEPAYYRHLEQRRSEDSRRSGGRGRGQDRRRPPRPSEDVADQFDEFESLPEEPSQEPEPTAEREPTNEPQESASERQPKERAAPAGDRGDDPEKEKVGLPERRRRLRRRLLPISTWRPAQARRQQSQRIRRPRHQRTVRGT